MSVPADLLRVLLAVRQVTDQLRLLDAGPPVWRIIDAVGLGLSLTGPTPGGDEHRTVLEVRKPRRSW